MKERSSSKNIWCSKIGGGDNLNYVRFPSFFELLVMDTEIQVEDRLFFWTDFHVLNNHFQSLNFFFQIDNFFLQSKYSFVFCLDFSPELTKNYYALWLSLFHEDCCPFNT